MPELTQIDAEGSGYMDFDAEVQPGYQNDKGESVLYSMSDNNGSATKPTRFIMKANAWGIDYYDYQWNLRQRLRFYVAGSQVAGCCLRRIAYYRTLLLRWPVSDLVFSRVLLPLAGS